MIKRLSFSKLLELRTANEEDQINDEVEKTSTRRQVTKSNLKEIQRIETAMYSNKAYFPGAIFYIFEKLNVFVKHCRLSVSLS